MVWEGDLDVCSAGAKGVVMLVEVRMGEEVTTAG